MEAPLVPVDGTSRAGTGLTNVAIEEGQGFGTLGRHQCGVDRFDIWGGLRSSNNGGCIIARLLDLTKLVGGVALHVVSGLNSRFHDWCCECGKCKCGCKSYG